MFGAISFMKYKNNRVELRSPCVTHMFYLKKSELCSLCFMQDLYQYHIHNMYNFDISCTKLAVLIYEAKSFYQSYQNIFQNL